MSWKYWLAIGLTVLNVGTAAAKSSIDDTHHTHERAERFVCDHPRHAYRAHGLSIMPEACR